MAIKKKGPVLKKVAGGVLKAASNFVPGGGLVRAGVSALSSMGGRGQVQRKRRTFSISKLQKRLIQAKINAKITRTRLSAFKGL